MIHSFVPRVTKHAKLKLIQSLSWVSKKNVKFKNPVWKKSISKYWIQYFFANFQYFIAEKVLDPIVTNTFFSKGYYEFVSFVFFEPRFWTIVKLSARLELKSEKIYGTLDPNLRINLKELFSLVYPLMHWQRSLQEKRQSCFFALPESLFPSK